MITHFTIFVPSCHNMKNTLHIHRLIIHLAVDLRIGPLGFAACLSKNVPLSRSVCKVLGLMFSIWHTSWLSSQSPRSNLFALLAKNPLSLPLLTISFIFMTKLLKLVSSSSTSEAASRLPRRYCAQLISGKQDPNVCRACSSESRQAWL